jgi:transposase
MARSGLSRDDAQARRRTSGGLADSGSRERASELQSFAQGVERDKAAVQAGLTLAINNGQVEGQVTRIKLIKRMMYGKAGFALLRQRVLHRI